MSVWDDFYRLTHLRIDYPNSMNKTAEIYGNGRNQVEVMITLRVADKHQRPLPLKETDLEKYVYLCDYYTGKEVSIPWSVANQDNGYNKVISYHSSSDNESKQNIADEDGFIRIHKFISCDRQDNGIVIAAGIDVPDVGKFNTSMFGTATRNGAKGKEGKIFKNPQYVNVIANEPIDYSNKSKFEFELSNFEKLSDITDKSSLYCKIRSYINGEYTYSQFDVDDVSVRTLKIRPRSIGFENNFLKEYFVNRAPVDQTKMSLSKIDWPPEYDGFKIFPEGYVSPYNVIGGKDIVLVYIGHNHIKIKGQYFLSAGSPDELHRYEPDIEVNHAESEKGKDIVLYIYKLNSLISSNSGDAYGWKDDYGKITMELIDSYGNSGTLTIRFDRQHSDNPRINVPAIEAF